MRLWDEARLAINAIEMVRNHHWITTFYDGKPDLWNTKPPLMIWLQVASIQLFGINEVACRIPSAVATFFSCVVLIWFSLRYFKTFWFGFIAVLVLITCDGFIQLHNSRTGDYDALLILFTTLQSVSLFLYLEFKKSKYVWLFFVALTLAFLTKGIAGLFFTPAFLIYILLQKKITYFIHKNVLIGILLFIAFGIGYYIWREIDSPGYLKMVVQNELLRHHQPTDYSGSNFWNYYHQMMYRTFSHYFFLLPFGILIGWYHTDQKVKRWTLYSILIVLVHFITISTSKTQHVWYDLPIYPFLSMLVANVIYTFFQWLRNHHFLASYLSVNLIPFLFLYFVFYTPYIDKINKVVYMEEPDPTFNQINYYLREAINHKRSVQNCFMLYNRCTSGYQGVVPWGEFHDTHIRFYLYALNEQGVSFGFKDFPQLSIHDTIICSQKIMQDSLEKHWNFSIIEKENGVVKYYLTQKKQ
jgi:4-amino-4-deoxy-L-arabinose transferase-like glycosyltransferase